MSPKRILIVEPHFHVLRRYKDILASRGYEVRSASNLAEALEILEKVTIDLAVIQPRLAIDDDPQDMSGLALAGYMDPKIPKILFSSSRTAQPPWSLPPRFVGYAYNGESPQSLLRRIEEAFERLDTVHTVILEDVRETKYQRLTPRYLVDVVAPYLDAIAGLEQVVQDALVGAPAEIWIRSISQASPVSVSLDGAGKAVELIRNEVVPWRRKHAKKIAQLELQEKTAQIEMLRADAQEKRARARRERAEAQQAEDEIRGVQRDAEHKRAELENEKLRLEIEQARIKLAFEIVDLVEPNAPEERRVALASRILKPLGVLTTSPLEVTGSRDSAHSAVTRQA